jgi:hypothetical protein
LPASGHSPLRRKRPGNDQSFVLGLHDGFAAGTSLLLLLGGYKRRLFVTLVQQSKNFALGATRTGN